VRTRAVVFEAPQKIALNELSLSELGADDVRVAVEFSGVSTGTEKMLWDGSMPAFPGMGYPLVPGYEAVGKVVQAGASDTAQAMLGQQVFVPGAKCYGEVRGLFGGSASNLIVPAARVAWLGAAQAKLGRGNEDHAVLLALAATAHHVLSLNTDTLAFPELIVGHGVLGRLLARIMVAKGLPAPTVWEIAEKRMSGAQGYQVITPDADPRRDYRHVCDVSGDAKILDKLIAKIAFGGVITLAGFYSAPLQFNFAPAFMREAQVRISAQWQPIDLEQVLALICTGALKLDGLITHRHEPTQADAAYRTAFGDSECLKMIIDWRQIT
jgi:bacteriochlorophyllide a dehydrogenase